MASVNKVHLGNFGADLYKKLTKCKVLVVGAGGIGCELLKTLVLSGFNDIEVIDLDTIDVSNLNRQFLFQKQHVGKSKASVARQSALQFNPDAHIKAYHDSIMSPDYDVNFFRQFSVVLNALDNRTARNHVNRMCLAADVPLVESGSAGYLGQVTLIQKGLTECYECQPKPHQKSYPGCTIRNTPSEPIHCIVWAKHLFNQLFGEADADEEVSPDTEDPEAGGSAGEMANTATGRELQRTSTQEWAKSINFDPEKLVKKLFVEDIKYLLSMDKLWKDRKPPVPLDLDNLTDSVVDNNSGLSDQKIWSVKECVENFHNCVVQLKTNLENKQDYLVWDKDDKAALNFVVSACNLRAYIFSIQQKCRFDVKSMAGNIIPAIATTNAVISGLIVVEAIKVISDDLSECRTTYLNKKPSSRKKLLQPSRLVPPNEKCYACSLKPEVTVMLDCSKITVKIFEEKILKNEFGVIAPDVEIDDGKGTILISSEEGETEQNNAKMLMDFKIGNGSRLKVEDFLQNYELVVNIVQCATIADGEDYKIVDEVPKPENVTELKSPRKSDRKRKASDNVQDEIEPKHSKIDRNMVNQSLNSDMVMVVDDTPTDSILEKQSEIRNFENGSKDSLPVVLVLDDDAIPCKSQAKILKQTSNAQIVIDDEENNDDIIML